MIQEKLTILKENLVIDEVTFTEMHEVLSYLRANHIIEEDDEADTFITHLAMASAREKNQEEPVQPVDEGIKMEIEAAPEFDQAIVLWNELNPLVSVDFPEAENDYFYLHLVTMLQNKNKGA